MKICTVQSASSSYSIVRRFLSVIVFLLIFTSIGFAQQGKEKKGEKDKEAQQNNWRKVTVCHNGNALEIDESALQAHLNHGDAVGPCTNISYTGTVTSYLEEVGKTQEPIGTELQILEESFAANGSATSDEIFVISKSELVLIEIVVQRGKRLDVLAFLNSTYYITEFIPSGPDDLLILVLFPINKLSELNSNADIRFVRPVYKPLTNSGVVTSLGDVAQRSDIARKAFGVTGNGITVGVLSDSYNAKNLAGKDYQNGDLPGPENPDGNLTPVNVLKEYPLETIGSRFSTVDEGRAMLQIVHDVAPKASLAFRTGVLSPTDMAQGILDLHAIAGCNVIVDDVTHYKEPFYQDGVIARAVDQVTAAGVQYFTSAGNFGRNSYQAQFNPSNNSSNHDFNLGGDVDELQNVRLGVGFFRIVLQWDDDYYTLPGATNDGALNDLDIFLISNEGDTLVNQNTNNLGLDPIEIMTFSVGEGFASANISIHRAAGNENVNFKYIVFEGKDFGFNEHAAGSSTIMGHANAAGAMAVGAVLYTNTPAFNMTPSIASFSSWGGLTVNGSNRNKPDFVAPNGANTTVNLGGTNIDEDLFPNFFGTSASAPHAAGVAALLLEAQTKFGVSFTLRQLLQQTAINMETPGFDHASGFGLIQADAAMRTFAAPIPSVTSLVVPPGASPGIAPFNLTVRGNNFHANSKVFLNESQLATTFVSSSELVASMPAFANDPPIQVLTLPITQSGNDGGLSNAVYLFRAPKKVIEVTADNKSKRFGERLPQFTASIKIDGVPMDSTTTLAALGLSNLQFASTAASLSGVGTYLILPVNEVSDSTFLEQFDYTFKNGTLLIEKMALEIIPEDLTKTYGEIISGLSFIYTYDKTNIDSLDDVAIFNLIQQSHTSTFIGVDSIALINRTRGIVNDGDLINRTRGIVNGTGWMVTPTTLNRTRGIVNDGDDLINRTRGIVNQLYLDIPDESFDTYLVDPTDAYTNRTRGIVNAGAMANGDATINRTRGIVNRTRGIVNDGALVNSDGGVEGFEDLILVVDSLDYAVSDLYSINVISGIDVTPEEYQQFIVPGAYFAEEAENFDITYGLGNLTILPATLTVEQRDHTIMDGDSIPAFTSMITGFKYDENDSSVFSSITYEPASYSGVGLYPIVPSFEFRDWANYVFNQITPGTLSVIELGTNGRIAFARYNEFSRLEIGVVNSDGKVPVSVVVGDGAQSIRDPQFSPDGNQIAFTLSPRDVRGPESIWKINVDGSGLMELSTDTLNHSSSFSPDGRKIGYIKNNEIAIMNSDGTGTSVLTSSNTSTPPNVNKRWTDFSPDGEKIIYVQSALDIFTDRFNSIWQVDINTKSAIQLSPVGDSLSYRSPVFLKDGSKIIYVRSSRFGQGPPAIMSMNPDGTGQTELYSSNQLPVDVAVSPDNTKLAFGLFDVNDGGHNLYTMNLDGSNVTEIYSEARVAWWPSWGTNPDLQGADLSVSAISVEKSIIAFGAEPWTNINYTVANSGTEPIIGPIEADLFNVIYNGESVVMDDVFVVLASGVVLLPGESVQLQFPVGHTNEWPSGSYSLRVRVDGNNTLAEVAESNNLSAIVNFNVVTNGRIAFVRDFIEIGLVNSDGTVPVSLPIGDGSQIIRDPEFSPDGNQIAFTFNAQGLEGSIWKMNVDGTELVELTTDSLNQSPSFSPDGSKIGFIKNNEIAIMNSDGTETSVLTSTSGNKRWTDFSPDGQRIIYVQPWNATGSSIWQVDINTGNTSVVSPQGNYRYRSPVFLKDGSKIISVRTGQGSVDIISMNPNGTGQTVLFSSNQLILDVAVSPDNKKLTFSILDDIEGDYNLYTMNLDGTNVTVIHSEAGILLWPSWGINPDVTGTDLWVSRISIENPEVVFEQEPWTNVNFTVANSGNAPVEGPIEADLFDVRYNGDPIVMDEVFVVLGSGAVLLPGESVELQFPVGHTNEWPSGSYSLRVRVDGNNTLAEVAESNNLSAIINFEVKLPAAVTADLWMLNSILIAYDSTNNLVLEQSGYSGNETISGVRHVEVSEQGNYAWLAELGPPYRLLKVSAAGVTLGADSTRQYGAIDLASDGTVYALESTGSISGGVVYILNSDGVQLLSAAYGGIDIVVDETNNAVWIVGDNIDLLDMNLNHVFTIDPFAWTATSVDFDVSGNAWIGEGRIPSIPLSFDQLMKVSPSGSILDTIPTLSGRPTTVRVNKTDGRVWYTNGVNLIYYSPDDQSHVNVGPGGFTFDIDYANGVIWTYAPSEVLKYDFDGNLITAIANNNVGGQLYLGAKSSTQGWEVPSQGFGGSSLTQGDITIYPNPVIDYMEVVHANDNIPIENISISLYDNSGAPVSSSISYLPSQVNHGLVVDMTALQPGFYFLHVNDTITTEVFRIQKN